MRAFPSKELKFALLAILAATHVTVWGANYTIQGELRYEIPNLEELKRKMSGRDRPKTKDSEKLAKVLPRIEDIPNVLLRQFQVDVDDDCRWKVTCVLVGNSNFNSFVTQYDNQNISYYYLLPSGNTNLTSLIVEETLVPRTYTSAAGEYAWLAFASGCYFRNLTNGMATSFGTVRSPSGIHKRYELPVTFTLSEAPPYVPMHVEYRTASLPSVTEDGAVRMNSLGPEFPENGYVSGELKSLGFTNKFGLGIPTAFEYRAYGPFTDASGTNRLQCTLVVQGTVTNISLREQKTELGIPNRISVDDRRSEQPAARYIITNGVLPATESQTVLAAHKRAKRLAEKTREAQGSRVRVGRGLFLAVAAFFFVLPLLAIMFKSKARKSQ
jgi:hypothetical protein